MKYKRLKLKKKNFFILITILVTIVSSLILSLNNSKSNEEIQLEKKLKKLNNIHEKIKYFNYNNIDRYISYKKENKDLSIEQIIVEVNIGLDSYSTSKETTYLNKNFIIINNYNHLSENFIPNNLETVNSIYTKKEIKLTKDTKQAFEKMANTALKDNIQLIITDGYKTYKEIETEYQSNKSKTKPGYSEHQTGLAIDIYFESENSKESQWLQNNAYKYGFILRYPKNKQKITGYEYNPYHYRYVGTTIAKKIKKANISFDEYYAKNIEN